MQLATHVDLDEDRLAGVGRVGDGGRVVSLVVLAVLAGLQHGAAVRVDDVQPREGALPEPRVQHIRLASLCKSCVSTVDTASQRVWTAPGRRADTTPCRR